MGGYRAGLLVAPSSVLALVLASSANQPDLAVGHLCKKREDDGDAGRHATQVGCGDVHACANTDSQSLDVQLAS